MIQELKAAYLDSLTELYKPRMIDFTPEYTSVPVEVDDETGEITEEETTTTTPEMANISFYASFSLFPETGVDDWIYVDEQYGTQYLWDGTTYIQMASSNRTFEQSFTAVDTVVLAHGLGKLKPNVIMIDGDGYEWDVNYESTDENNGVANWNGNKTGTLYLS